MKTPEPTAIEVFSGDIDSARERLGDVVSVFLRRATAVDLNRQSYQLSMVLSVHYGLTDLQELIEAEIDSDRRALEFRGRLVVVSARRTNPSIVDGVATARR